MKIKEIKRFRYEGLDYIIGINEIQIQSELIAEPWILVTTKTSRKIRRRTGNKADAHFNLVGLKNPIILTRKIYFLFESYLKNYNFVLFSGHTDKQYKREELYLRCLKYMGFNLIKHNKNGCLVGRKSIKKKQIRKLTNYYMGM